MNALAIGSAALFCFAMLAFVPSQLSAAAMRNTKDAECVAICKDSACERSGTICTCTCKDGQAICSCGTPAE